MKTKITTVGARKQSSCNHLIGLWFFIACVASVGGISQSEAMDRGGSDSKKQERKNDALTERDWPILAGLNTAGSVDTSEQKRESKAMNSSSQLADGTIDIRIEPVATLLPREVQEHKSDYAREREGFLIAACGSRTFFKSGSVFGVGDNSGGELGDGTIVRRNEPVAMLLPREVQEHKIIQIAAGVDHTVLLTDNGSLWAVGKNEFGQLGDGTNTNQNQLVPMILPDELRQHKIVQIAAGLGHTVILADNGKPWAVGYFGLFRRGTDTDQNQLVPMILPAELRQHKIIQVATGTLHTVLISDNGSVWAMGDNTYGQLGDGTNTLRNLFVPMLLSEGLLNHKIIQIAMGHFHTVILADNGSLWAVGSNHSGELGDGTKTSQNQLVPMIRSDELQKHKIIQIAAGVGHTVILADNGSVWTAGSHVDDKLGDKKQASRTQLAPMILSDELQKHKIIQIAAGFAHTAVLSNNGKVWAVGSNMFGELGNGTNADVDQFLPTLFSSPILEDPPTSERGFWEKVIGFLI